MTNIFEKFFSKKGPESVAKQPELDGEKMTEEEKKEYEKNNPGEIYKPGDIGAYRNKEDNIAVNEARKTNPEVNDISELKEDQLPETFINGEIRSNEEAAAQKELMDKIAATQKNIEDVKNDINNTLN